MLKKMLITTITIMMFPLIGHTENVRSEDTLARYTCFRTDQSGNNASGKVVIFQQRHNDNINGEDFNSGQHSTIAEFSVHVFKGVNEVRGLNSFEQLQDLDTLELSENLLSQVGTTYHEKRDNYLEYNDGVAQRRGAFLGFSWNDRDGSLALNSGFTTSGIFSNRRENFEDTDQGSMVCNFPDFISERTELVLNEETLQNENNTVNSVLR